LVELSTTVLFVGLGFLSVLLPVLLFKASNTQSFKLISKLYPFGHCKQLPFKNKSYVDIHYPHVLALSHTLQFYVQFTSHNFVLELNTSPTGQLTHSELFKLYPLLHAVQFVLDVHVVQF